LSRVFDSFCGGCIKLRILPPQKESKIGQNNPQNRRSLGFNTASKKLVGILWGCVLLVSCSRQSHWSHEKIHSHQEKFSYSKVVYRGGDPIRGVDLEFIQSENYFKTYLLVHSIAVPCIKGNPKKILVKIEIDGVTIACEADRLEGGQRFVLEEKMAHILIDTLLDKKNVIISIPGYRSPIAALGFKEHFSKIGRSLLENPFHLPF
jgi:hypothetical protein